MRARDWRRCASAAAWAWRSPSSASKRRHPAQQAHGARPHTWRKTIMATHRIALVTGGMGGLGEAICMKMAALGYTVVTTHSPRNAKANEWLQSMKGQGYTLRAYPCDVARFDSAAACVNQAAG